MENLLFQVLLLKVNKEGPSKKDIWRAPGNLQQVRILSRSMRDGALVNVANFDEKTVASVIKVVRLSFSCSTF